MQAISAPDAQKCSSAPPGCLVCMDGPRSSRVKARQDDASRGARRRFAEALDLDMHGVAPIAITVSLYALPRVLGTRRMRHTRRLLILCGDYGAVVGIVVPVDVLTDQPELHGYAASSKNCFRLGGEYFGPLSTFPSSR